MKRLIIMILVVCGVFVIFNVTLFATEWKTTNQVTLTWQPVTTLDNGEVIPQGDTVSYELFAAAQGQNKDADKVLMGSTSELSYTLTFAVEGFYFIGVRAVRSRNNEIISYSVISWSDDPAYMKSGLSEGVRFFFNPSNAKDMAFE